MTTRILIVEDDAISQEVIRALCETRGLTVDVAADGFLGLKLLSEGRQPVALIDYHLPEMDGYALARLMREVSANWESGLKLVGITADRDGLAARRGADALFDAILVKPLDPGTLFTTLDRLMAPEEPPEDAPADPDATAVVRAEAFLDEPDADRARAAAEAFWRRRGHAGRPRACTCPAPGPEQAAAIGICFEIVAPAEAELALMLDASGLDGLRALRADPATCLIPAIDLTGRLSGCEAAFRVDEAESWTRVATILRENAERRARLNAHARHPAEPSLRLLSLLYVAPVPLVLRRLAGGDAWDAARDAAKSAGKDALAASIETGLASADLVARLGGLNERELVTCTPGQDSIGIALTEAGRTFLTSPERPAASAGKPRPEETVLRTRVEALLEQAAVPGEDDLWAELSRRLARRRDRQEVLHEGSDEEGLDAEEESSGGDAAPDDPAPAASLASLAPEPVAAVYPLGIEDEAPILNRRKVEELDGLLGPETVAGLRGRLVAQLRAAFRSGDAAGATPDALGREAHVLISIAGMLGCDRLSWACTRLERAAKAGEPVAAHLAKARSVRDQTLAALGQGATPTIPSSPSS